MEQQTEVKTALMQQAESLIALIDSIYDSIIKVKSESGFNLVVNVSDFNNMCKGTFLYGQYMELIMHELKRALGFDFMAFHFRNDDNVFMKFDWSEDALKYKELFENESAIKEAINI